MLISFEEINNILVSKNIIVNGSFHIGAHECEEIEFYNKLCIKNENIEETVIKSKLLVLVLAIMFKG